MSGLLVPRHLREETERESAAVLSRARQHHICEDFDADLKRMDSRMQMVWFDENVNLMGIAPGRYHLLIVDGVDVHPIPICDEDGGFIEPNSGLFEWLERQDMWDSRANADRVRAKDEARKAKERRKQSETEDRLEELKDRYNAAFRTSISMNDSASWSQNESGKRGRKGRPHAIR